MTIGMHTWKNHTTNSPYIQSKKEAEENKKKHKRQQFELEKTEGI